MDFVVSYSPFNCVRFNFIWISMKATFIISLCIHDRGICIVNLTKVFYCWYPSLKRVLMDFVVCWSLQPLMWLLMCTNCTVQLLNHSILASNSQSLSFAQSFLIFQFTMVLPGNGVWHYIIFCWDMFSGMQLHPTLTRIWRNHWIGCQGLRSAYVFITLEKQDCFFF